MAEDCNNKYKFKIIKYVKKDIKISSLNILFYYNFSLVNSHLISVVYVSPLYNGFIT